MLFYFGLWVYLINVVLLLTLSVPDECCSTFDFECTWWMLFYFGHWVYLMNVVLLLTLNVPDKCCSTFDFECICWMLFYFWLSVYLIKVICSVVHCIVCTLTYGFWFPLWNLQTFLLCDNVSPITCSWSVLFCVYSCFPHQ